MIANECSLALQKNIPLWGVCWYFIIYRPDWDNLDDWHHSEIWDLESMNDNRRILNTVASNAFLIAQGQVVNFNSETKSFFYWTQSVLRKQNKILVWMIEYCWKFTTWLYKFHKIIF